MQDARAGEAQRRAGSAFETGPQRQMRALDLLHRELPHRVLRGREMPLRDPRLVRVVTRDAKGGQEGLEFQDHHLLPGANDIREHSPRVMINRMPQPPCPRFGADDTPHFIERGGAPCWDASVV